ncbi:hypothetical protein Tco_0134486 [Tanacetum coccineum]
MTPRSCPRWKTTGKIFKTVGLRWVPTREIFTYSTTKVDCEPLNGSNEDITNPYECAQTLNGFKEFKSDKQAMTSDHNSSELEIHDHSNEPSSLKLVPKVVPPADKTATSRQELELLLPIQTMMRGSNTLSWKPCQGGSSELSLPDHRYKRRYCSLIPAESDSLPHAHAQTTKTYYKHQDSRIKKAQELKIKTSANSDIKDPSSETKLRGRFLESFQEDAKYEHVDQDTRSQDGKDDKDKQGKDLKISESKTKSKDNDKG